MLKRRKVVVIAATEMEIAKCRDTVDGCQFAVVGMGATNMAMGTIGAIETFKPDLVILAGIAGAIDKSIQIGDVVFVTADYQADLGAWRSEEQKFVLFDTPLIKVENRTNLRGVSACSINTACSLHAARGDAQIESMEGAAFFQVASRYHDLEFMQIRSISNYTDSPRHLWQIPRAVESLCATVTNLVDIGQSH